jgi:starvation-inducible outer membrane lipoprotein
VKTWLAFALALVSSGCVVVPQNRRAKLADPMMALSPDALEAQRKQKLYSSREGAAGGEGRSAGGGCACQ